jgi:lipoprotein-anchoring transpeptidase ErfK/SrfK
MKNIIKITFITILFSLPIFIGAQDLSIDSDNDGLSDHDEINKYFTDQNNPDTDGDGFDDGKEIKYGFSPRFPDKKKLISVDSDNDELNDLWEINLGTNLLNADSDNDGHTDGEEVLNGFDPLSDKNEKLEKLIKVSLKNQGLSYYLGDKKITNFKISSGIKRLPTPRGTFSILQKTPVKLYKGVGYRYPNTKWNLLFSKSGLYIHGAYWHNKFGTPMSHGCINVSYENMESLYNMTATGTKVIIE